MPLVSVIMSVYNGEKFLHEAMDSILQQSFQDFEFIIIDDCSTDNTAKILDEYSHKDSRIKIIKKEKNIGLKGFIENLNLGISLAEGKYIARMDADDISAFDRFKKQVDYLDNHPDIFIVGAQINLINEKNEIIGEKLGALEHKVIISKMPKSIQLFHPVIMFRNSPNVKYREKMLYCEDYDFYLNIITDGKKLANIDEKLLNYRVLNDSISRKGNHFAKKLMVEKSIYFYILRKEKGNDLYDVFDNNEVLEISNLNYKNKKEELLFAMKTAIKLNSRSNLTFLIKKFKLHYPNNYLPFIFIVFSKSPMILFRILKKLPW